MKRIIPFAFLAIIIFSCSESGPTETGSENILEDFAFSTDTLLIDPGEELINLANGLRLSDVTPDGKYMYILIPQDQGLLKIDLDNQVLVERYQFEKEGPNGIGDFPTAFQLLDGDRLYISSFNLAGIFNFQGEKLEDMNIKAGDVEGLEMDNETQLNYNVIISPDGSKHFSLPGDFMEGSRDFAVVDLEGKTGKLIDIPEMDIAGDFRIILQSQTSFSIYLEDIATKLMEDYLYISSTATSKIYRYDIASDSLQLFEFPHKITPTQKTGEVRSKVESQEEFQAEMLKLQEQVRYNPLLWDEVSGRFFRFGGKNLPKLNPDDPAKSDVYLYAFDKDLNLIGETELTELEKIPSNSFFKEGKLWSYVNIDDELGFAVMDFNFN